MKLDTRPSELAPRLFEALPSESLPCYILDEETLLANVRRIAVIRGAVGCKVLLALKAFASFSFFPMFREQLDGVSASSVNEVRLGKEEIGKDIHYYSPALTPRDYDAVSDSVTHIVYNSIPQWNRLRRDRSGHLWSRIKHGVRLNLERSESAFDACDTSSPFSRFGVTRKEFDASCLSGISGLHVHNLCRSNSDAVQRNIEHLEDEYGAVLADMDWLNLGGGHLMTHPGYDADLLALTIRELKARFRLDVIFEPGEAIVYNAGYLVADVADIFRNRRDIAIVNVSAAAHMPNVGEIPYVPHILGSGPPGVKPYSYIIGSNSCLSCDSIGEYSFETPLSVGQKVVFSDMAQYTMVRNTHFNGLKVPGIGMRRCDGTFDMLSEFGYENYRSRLACRPGS